MNDEPFADFHICESYCKVVSFQIPSQFVENMLEVHQKYTELIETVFSSDQQFVGALDKVVYVKQSLF